MEERFKDYYNLPKIILDIMNWLCETRFYKNTFEERKFLYEEVQEKWKFCDFRVEKGTLENPIIISIGEIPRYKYDKEKVLVINFENEDICYLSRGYAVGDYASRILRKRYPIPKYMKKQLSEFIEKYKNKENINDCRN